MRRFGTLPYAHKPGVAAYLNDWAREFAAGVPEALWSATFYPEPEAATYVPELVAAGVEVFKVHVQVGEFDLDDPLLDPAWGALADAGMPVVIHAGSGPVGNEFTGPGSLRRVLRRHPRLTAVVAHMGAPEYAEFLALAERYERTHLDTTMVFTDFFEADAPYPDQLLPRLADLRRQGAAGQRTSRRSPTPTPHQLDGWRLATGAAARRRLAARGLLAQRRASSAQPRLTTVGGTWAARRSAAGPRRPLEGLSP